ncbi:GIN domain-containing protein [Flagellimonas sp. GZD32]|uniref:GIN domain-containing protein n=1 Tax=Flagellimonas cixiensis TaxID=3228750 RepID=UPI0035C931F3
MRKLFLLIFVIAPLLTIAQRKPKIKGSRIVTEVSDELPAFNAIVLNDDLEIHLERTNGPGYHIVADDNLIDILKFEVEGTTLMISSYYDVTANKQFDITVNYSELQSIAVKKGSVSTNNVIEGNELFVDGFENTRMDIKANVAVMDINLEENSKGDFHVDADSLNISLNSRTEALVYTTSNTAVLDLEGNATLTLEGSSERLQANFFQQSRYKGEAMQAVNFKLAIQDDASARVFAVDEVDISAKGSSVIYLYGTPKIQIQEFLDTAQLIKKQ